MVLALFFCSGATALIYEVVWSKLLAQMFGSTIYAQTVVLAVFMGGLALGNRLFGRWADRLRQPVRVYGCLEIAIGIYAFLFPGLDRVADQIFVALGTPIVEHAGWLLLLKGVLSAALLLGPTILMGGTLPLLAAWLQRSYCRRRPPFGPVLFGQQPGRGYWARRWPGFGWCKLSAWSRRCKSPRRSTWSSGSAAILLIRPPGPRRKAAAGQSRPGVRQRRRMPSRREPCAGPGMMVALTGGVSMGLEVLASRSLALIFGSSLQSFAVVLIAFILGIGLGSAWIASPADRGRRANEPSCCCSASRRRG